MTDKELIREMYNFAIELSLSLKYDKFDSHRNKWNTLLTTPIAKANRILSTRLD